MTPIPRRTLLAGTAGLLLAPAALLAKTDPPTKPGPLVQVWKGPSCGCCVDWIKHLEAHGFRTQVQDTGNTDARLRPAREIQRLLKERPPAVGLAVPAMPVGAPGMDGPSYEGRKDPYDVLLLAKDGSSRVFQTYR